MSDERDAQKARAEAKFKKAEEKATAGAEAKAEHDAAIVARDANTERLKGLRLARDETDRAVSKAEQMKQRVRKPSSG